MAKNKVFVLIVTLDEAKKIFLIPLKKGKILVMEFKLWHKYVLKKFDDFIL